MSKRKITLKRVNQRENKIVSVGCDIERIELDVDGHKYTITPDFDGFMISKEGFVGPIKITPHMSNEIIVE